MANKKKEDFDIKVHGNYLWMSGGEHAHARKLSTAVARRLVKELQAALKDHAFDTPHFKYSGFTKTQLAERIAKEEAFQRENV